MAWTITKIVETGTDQRNLRERMQNKAAISLSLYLITRFSPVIKGGFVPFLTTHTECQEPAHLVCRWYETTMASNSDKRCHGTLITSAQNILFPFGYLTYTVWAGKLPLLFLWEKSFSVSKWEGAQLLWVLLGKRLKAETTPVQFCWDLWRFMKISTPLQRQGIRSWAIWKTKGSGSF